MKQYILRYIALLVSWPVFAMSAMAQGEIMSMSLQQSIDYALENNKNIQNARFDAYIAEARTKEVLSAGLPQVSASADLQYFVELPTQILPGEFSPQSGVFNIGDQTFLGTLLQEDPNNPGELTVIPGQPIEAQFGFPWNSTAGISINQLVADGTFFLGLKAAKTFVDLQSIAANRTREDIAYEVSKAYYSALLAQEQLNLLDANIGRLLKLFEETKVLNQNGFVEKIDVDRLQISYTNLQLERDRVARIGQLSRDLLKFQMGMPVDKVVELTESIDALGERPEALLNMDGINAESRIEFDLLKTQLALEEYNQKRFNMGYLPSLYAFGSYQFNAQRNSFNFLDSNERWFPISVVGLQLNVPIFDGLRKHQQIQQSKLEQLKIRNNMEIFRNSIRLELRKNAGDVVNAYNNLQSLERNKQLAQRVFDVSTIKYREGVGSSLELNDSESQLKEAESNYLSGLFQYLISRVELSKAKGEFSQYHDKNE
ncbi:MAG: TolC family protein [Bacteroidota bacterium]